MKRASHERIPLIRGAQSSQIHRDVASQGAFCQSHTKGPSGVKRSVYVGCTLSRGSLWNCEICHRPWQVTPRSLGVLLTRLWGLSPLRFSLEIGPPNFSRQSWKSLLSAKVPAPAFVTTTCGSETGGSAYRCGRLGGCAAQWARHRCS